MRISSKGPASLQQLAKASAQKAQQAKTIQIVSALESGMKDMQEHGKNSELYPLFHALAKEAEEQALSEELIGERFVHAVIDARFSKLLGKQIKSAKDEVGRAVSQDSSMCARIAQQLKILKREEKSAV